MAETQFTVNHDDDEDVLISKQKKTPWLFNYRTVGDTKVNQEDSKDALALICEFSKTEMALLKKCIEANKLTPHNKLQLRKRDMTTSEQRILGLAVTSWIKKGLLLRESRENFMVSPFFFVPKRPHHTEVLEKWQKLLAKKGTK